MRLAAWLLAAPLAAQSVDVYSEFRRLNTQGAIADSDKAGKPREILSPAMIRNGWHSFHLAVNVQPGRDYVLYMLQNPERLQLKLYREHADASGTMELLEPVKLSVNATAGRTPDIYLLEVFVPANAAAGRVRVEAQLNDGYHWVIYPLEARVFAGIVPAFPATGARFPAVTESSAETARRAFREYACGETPAAAPVVRGVRASIRRNALQDVALARMLEQKMGREPLLAKLTERAGGNLCGPAPIESPFGPEWYLRIRDFLFRETSH